MTAKKSILTLCAAVLGVFVLSLIPLAAEQGGGGHLKVKAQPGRTGVYLDGKYLGPAANFRRARTYAVPAGEHELLLREPRYEDYKTTVRIEAGRTTTLTQAMKPLQPPKPPFGKLRFVGFEKYCAVYVNNGYMGHCDEFNAFWQGLKLNPGDYDVKVVSTKGETLLQQKVSLAANQTIKLRAQ
jgi:hypothetical protein